MSTRTQVYNSQAFHENWNKIVNILEDIKSPLEATSDNVQNLARLKKAITYVNELILASDKELIPVSVWQNFQNPCATILGQIQANQNTPNESNLNSANNSVDSLIQYLSPYVLTGKGAAQAVGRSLSAYSKAIHDHTEMVQNQMVASLRKAEETEAQLDTLLQKTNAMEEKIVAYENELFADGDKNSTKSKISSLLGEINSSRDEILEYKRKLAGTESDNEDSIISLVEANKTKVVDAKNTAEQNLAEMVAELEQLKQIH